MGMGFTYKNTHSSTYGITMSTDNRPALPGVKVVSFSPQYMDGTLDYSSINGRYNYEDKVIQLKLQFKASGLSELVTKVQSIAKWLSGSGVLKFDDTPDRYYNARVLQTVDFAPKLFGYYGEMTVSFRCEPFSINDTEFDETYELTADTPLTVSCPNNGDITVYPEIYVQNGGNGTFTANFFSYTGQLGDLIIDGEAREVTHGGGFVTNQSNLYFPELHKGSNSLTLQCTVAVTVNIVYAEKYLF